MKYLFNIKMDNYTFELELLKSFRIGWTVLDHPDYAVLFHFGFLQPGITLMLSWRKMARRSQKQKIREYLEEGNTINPIMALNLFGCFRLSDVIFKIRKDTSEEYIKTTLIENRNGNKYAEYKKS